MPPVFPLRFPQTAGGAAVLLVCGKLRRPHHGGAPFLGIRSRPEKTAPMGSVYALVGRRQRR